MPFATIIGIVTLGVIVFECLFGIVLGYHWVRFTDTKSAVLTLLIYSVGALVLTAILVILAAAIAL